jgi:hypothetical protein
LNQDPKTLEELLQEFETEVRHLARQRFPVRSQATLKAAAEQAWILAETLTGFKEDARAKGDGEVANALLSAQCFSSAIASEIEMWSEIRAERATEAWSKLVDAQEYIAVANRAHSTSGATEMIERLALLERTLFPPVVFVSPSFTFRPGRCSICEERFDLCPHEEDVVYAGRLCRELQRTDVRAIEVSIVENPRDRRCRLTTREDEAGTHRDWFTGEIVEVATQSDEPGKVFDAIIYAAHRLRAV